MKLLIMQFSAASHHFISLGSKYASEHSVLKPNTLILFSSLNVRDQDSHSYKTITLTITRFLDFVHRLVF
jgi:hypothetical protein